MQNHYETLGVSEDATTDDIKKAYRKLASKHHPDKGGDTATFQNIQTAYDTLGDEEKRRQYDFMRSNPHMGHGGFGGAHGDPFGQHFEFNIHDIFNMFNGGRRVERNNDIRIRFMTRLSDCLKPQKRTVNIQTASGEKKTIDIEIPAGISQNTTIRYSEMGETLNKKAPPGDLYVDVAVHNDTEYEVQGLDLCKVVELDLFTALLGGTTIVKKLDGTKVEVDIPAGTQNNSVIRLKGCGLPHPQSSVHVGNILLQTKILIPKDLTEEQKQGIIELRDRFNEKTVN